MSRKREKPSYFSRQVPALISKRRRPLPRPPLDPSSSVAGADDDAPTSKPSPPPAVVAMGLPPNCSVLDLKSRFEIYGPISRIRIDRDEVGYITFRSKDSAVAAIAASLDPSFGISIDSKPVQVSWANDPLAQWGVGVGINRGIGSRSSSSSKLLKAEVPLSKYGRANKLASTIVNPQASTSSDSTLEVPFRGREIVAYDDIL
ncbi:uncharacterized protein At1g27050 [Punica granatum]|uniref:RRM domain-containing protein n=2 Tax=Punica granatum TaxID=22663 RepID=A0A218WUT6_PUNGR|nr:uncharacterized protein At1g27050 [Punica granatum]OWM75991.1 hypothetical protein CDL15_Pgr009636 [Punica granatum]PKI41289.1 hypothetical protein CRG98_038310 [Punica granatum]